MSYLPDETLTDPQRPFPVSIKGPLTTPVGGGIRSLNVTLRQELDLYVCMRPVRWYEGLPSPLRDPVGMDVVIFQGKHRGHLHRHRIPGRQPGTVQTWLAELSKKHAG